MTTHSEKLGNASTRSEYNVRSRSEQVNQLPSELDLGNRRTAKRMYFCAFKNGTTLFLRIA